MLSAACGSFASAPPKLSTTCQHWRSGRRAETQQWHQALSSWYGNSSQPCHRERLLPTRPTSVPQRSTATPPPRSTIQQGRVPLFLVDRKSTRLNSSHLGISYAV